VAPVTPRLNSVKISYATLAILSTCHFMPLLSAILISLVSNWRKDFSEESRIYKFILAKFYTDFYSYIVFRVDALLYHCVCGSP